MGPGSTAFGVSWPSVQRQVGRPVSVTPAQLGYATQLREAGETIAQIVAMTGVTRSSLYRHLPPRSPEPLTAAGLAPDDRSAPAGYPNLDRADTQLEKAAAGPAGGTGA